VASRLRSRHLASINGERNIAQMATSLNYLRCNLKPPIWSTGPEPGKKISRLGDTLRRLYLCVPHQSA
jgi:hypothetical protein